MSLSVRELLAGEPLLMEALRRRAAKNYRKPRMELLAILREVLTPELEQIQRELAAEQEVRTP